MKVTDFRREKSCEKSVMFDHLIEPKNKRPLLLLKGITAMCEDLKAQKDLNSCINHLREILNYEADWFETSWQKSIYENDDLISFSRFLEWFFHQGYEVLEANSKCTAVFAKPLYNQQRSLEQTVNLIVCKGHETRAFIISPKKPWHSLHGRSSDTRTSEQLEAMVAKEFLENKYKDILVGMIHLRQDQDEDGSMWPEFTVGSTKKCNLQYAKYEEAFDADKFHRKLEVVANSPVACNCYDCRHAALCKAKGFKDSIPAMEKGEYVLPQYTEEQQAVINHHKGPMVIVAGPGSGKTATLVGRIKAMQDAGIRTEKILVVTYTKKAAGELQERISSFCNESDMPYVATINSFGNDVLMQNKTLVGRKIRLMSAVIKAQLIENLLKALPPLTGFKYGKLYGKTGLVKTVERKLDSYFSIGDYETFRRKEPKLGDDFFSFADLYREAVKGNDYITYDEQVTMCTDLFRQYPEVLEQYQDCYEYIMVDEFQDVNKDNAEMLYLLADKHKNLCVVGDDDQAVYGFRGGCADYMLQFKQQFPSATEFVLSTNFRSTKEIVDMAETVVSGNERIEKNMKSARGSGITPFLCSDNSAGQINHLIEQIKAKGYHYGDVAVLSSKNEPLNSLHDELSVPTVLAKAYLIHEPLFVAIRSILGIYYKGTSEDSYIASLLMTAHPEEACVFRNQGQSLYDSIKGSLPDITDHEAYAQMECTHVRDTFMREMAFSYRAVETATDPKALVKAIARIYECEGSQAEQALLELVHERSVKDIQKLYEQMDYMSLYEDDTRVEKPAQDAVTLITVHESKGKEYPVVIIQDGETFVDEPEKKRLMYVAATRAKDVLIVCYDENKQNGKILGQDLLEELA